MEAMIRTADDLNVKGVIHLGDVVENNNDGVQYDTAREVFYKIPDAGSYTYLVISLACTGSDPGRNNNTGWDPSHEAWLKEILEKYQIVQPS